MAVYTVHEPPPQVGDVLAPSERFIFVRDGFVFSALLLGPLWLLRHRLWLALLFYLLLMVGLGWLLRAAGSASLMPLAAAAIALWLGIEASSLRRWGLARAGWRQLGVVIGNDLEAAERRFFDAWIGRRGPVPGSEAAGARARETADVIGSFPQPGARV
jgi:Protein of unknown function (DUF2628)